MNPTALEIAYIAGGLGILGTLLGAWIAFRFALEVARRDSKKLAAKQLREAFAIEVARLQHLDGIDYFQTRDILEGAFDKHQMAVNEFGFFLDNTRLKSLTTAWKEYCTIEGIYDHFYQYDKDPHTAIDRINTIIALTRE